MWLRILHRLRQSLGWISLWKRAFAVSISLSLLVQSTVGLFLWREARVRWQLAGRNATLSLGPSPLPSVVETSLSRWVSREQLQLLAPVQAVAISYPTDDDLRTISYLSKLTSLKVLYGNLSATGLQQIGWLSHLEELDLENDCVDPQALCALPGCTRLRQLKICGRMAPEALEPLKHSYSLHKLYLKAVRVYAGDSAGSHDSILRPHLAAVARIPNLKELKVHSPGIADDDLKALANAERLEKLFVYQLRLQSRSLNSLGRMPRLKRLSLEIETAREVEPLRGFPSLNVLCLQQARISPEFLLSLKQLPQLDTLSFELCWVNNSLASLAQNSKLRRLNLGSSDANVDGIRQIGRLESLELLVTPGFQDMEEYRDLFPKLESNSSFDWREAMMKEKWKTVPAMGVGGGMF